MRLGALLLCVAAAAVLPAAARPCPPLAVFMHSAKHNEAFCVCAPGSLCTGPQCDYGGEGNSPSFGSADVGFPLHCTDCRWERGRGKRVRPS